MRLEEIDLTGEEYKNYSYYGFDDIFLIKFSDTEITIDSREFDKLKEDIIKKEELAKVEFNFANDAKEPSKRETLLKELIKVIDSLKDLDKESEEIYEKEFGELVAEKPYPSQEDIFELKQKTLPLVRKMDELKYYKEKLEAQLKYGELQ